ncbi:MAG: hypothetical protein ABL993_09160, partial [Vicinamibacterales bacterium]
MFESIYKAFENFIIEFSFRRLAGALLLLVVGLVGFGLVERYSPYFVMGRLERATGLLERLTTIDSRPAAADLKGVRDAIGRQLKVQVEPGPLIGVFTAGGPSTLLLWKFASGIGAWLLFALVYLPNVKLDTRNWNGVLGAVFIGAIWGFIGSVAIQDDWVTWKVL